MSKDDHNDTLMEVQQQLEGHAAAITQINATLQALNTTLNEVRMNQELQYRDPIREDRNNQPHRRGPRRVPRMDDDFHDRGQPSLAKPKFTIPQFRGKNDPDAYCEWESKIELMFRYYKCPDDEKVALATLEFSDYALSWWTQLGVNRHRNYEGEISTWDELKQIMRKRFIPPHYYREIKTKLRRLIQGSRTVDEYFKEMEMLIQRANVEEDEETTMVRFIDGLNRPIANTLRLQTYIDLEEAVHKAIEIEQQLKEQRFGSFSTSQYYRGNNSNSDFKSSKPPFVTNKSSLSNGSKQSDWKKGAPAKTQTPSKQPNLGDSSAKRTREIECFKCKGRGHYSRECPNTRLLLLKDNGEYTSDSDNTDPDMPELVDDSDNGDELVEPPKEGDFANFQCLVVRRTLNIQMKDDDSQRANIFHSRCFIKGNLCSLIIDSGSCSNVVSSYLVDSLKLHCTKHPKPYHLQWLNECSEVKVMKQSLVTFKLGNYDDTSTPRELHRASLSSRALTCWQADPSSFPAPRAPSSSNPAYSSSIQLA